MRETVTLGMTGITVNKNGFGALPIQRISDNDAVFLLRKAYNAGRFKTLSEQEYIDIVCEALSLLPMDTVIHRLTGDGDKKLLVAPMWSANKKHVLNELSKYLIPV